jgi:RecB family exonuclease
MKLPALTPKQIKETKDILKKYYDKIDVVEPDVLAVEQEFWLDLGNDISLLGYIDRIDKVGDDAYRIVDYKTSKKAYPIDKNIQLDIYAIGFAKVRGLPDDAKIYKQLDFIKVGKQTDPFALHNQDRNEQIISDLKDISYGIKEKVETQRENTEAWTPIENEFCWSCDFKDRCDKDRGIVKSLFDE